MSLTRITREIVARQGWTPGTELENRVAFLLHRYKLRPQQVLQQHRIGRFRVDFAVPDIQFVVEADGWWHRSPDGAARDAERDAWLRSQGWLVFRVDDRDGESLETQVARVAHLIHLAVEHWNGGWGTAQAQAAAKEARKRAVRGGWHRGALDIPPQRGRAGSREEGTTPVA